MHQVSEIARHAPTFVHACFDGERNMRIVRTEDHNPAQLSATVMLGLQRYHGKFFQEMSELATKDVEAYAPVPALTRGLKFNEDGIQIKIEKQGLYGRGIGASNVVIPPNVGVHSNLLSTKNDEALLASLIQYYLTATDWNVNVASALHGLVDKFVEDGGDHPAEAKSASGKIAAWLDLYAWAKGCTEETRARPWWRNRRERADVNVAIAQKLVHLRKRVDRLRSLSIGGLVIRSKRADGFGKVKTVGSYFLAKVEEDVDEWYEVGRVVRFIRHIPPGCDSVDDAIFFAEAEWLIPTTPPFTTRSRLPMVVLDNTPDRYLQDGDAADGLITRIWPAHGIEPQPVCVLPLDSKHDVPRTVRLTYPSIRRSEVARNGLGKYRRAPPPLNQIRPGEQTMDEFTLGVVILPYSYLNKKFKRPGDVEE